MSESTEQPVLCPSCGKENPEGSKFCVFCGEKMSSSSVPESTEAEPEPSVSPSAGEPESSPDKEENESSSEPKDDKSFEKKEFPVPVMTPEGKISTGKEQSAAVAAVHSSALFIGCLTALLGHIAYIMGQSLGLDCITDFSEYLLQTEETENLLYFLLEIKKILLPFTAVSGILGYVLSHLFPVLALIFLFSAWGSAVKCGSRGCKPGGLSGLRVLALIRAVTVAISGILFVVIGVFVILLVAFGGTAIAAFFPVFLGWEGLLLWLSAGIVGIGLVFFILRFCYYIDIMSIAGHAASSVEGKPTSSRLSAFPAVVLLVCGILCMLSGAGGMFSSFSSESAETLSSLFADAPEWLEFAEKLVSSFRINGIFLSAGEVLFGISDFCFGCAVIRYLKCEKVNRRFI